MLKGNDAAGVSGSCVAGPGYRPDQSEAADSIEAAVRYLAHIMGRQHPHRVDATQGVLLDLQIDDVRCRLEITGSPAKTPPDKVLTHRETQVAYLVAQGYPNKMIATALGISAFTVSSYLRRVFVKTGVNSRAAMVAHTLERGLLPGPWTPSAVANDT